MSDLIGVIIFVTCAFTLWYSGSCCQIYTAADGKKPGPIQHQMANRLNLSQSHKAKPCQFFKVTLCQIFVACSGGLVRVALEKKHVFRRRYCRFVPSTRGHYAYLIWQSFLPFLMQPQWGCPPAGIKPATFFLPHKSANLYAYIFKVSLLWKVRNIKKIFSSFYLEVS